MREIIPLMYSTKAETETERDTEIKRQKDIPPVWKRSVKGDDFTDVFIESVVNKHQIYKINQISDVDDKDDITKALQASRIDSTTNLGGGECRENYFHLTNALRKFFLTKSWPF